MVAACELIVRCPTPCGPDGLKMGGTFFSSRDLYARAFELNDDDYYTGINAAAKSVLLGGLEFGASARVKRSARSRTSCASTPRRSVFPRRAGAPRSSRRPSAVKSSFYVPMFTDCPRAPAHAPSCSSFLSSVATQGGVQMRLSLQNCRKIAADFMYLRIDQRSALTKTPFGDTVSLVGVG